MRGGGGYALGRGRRRDRSIPPGYRGYRGYRKPTIVRSGVRGREGPYLFTGPGSPLAQPFLRSTAPRSFPNGTPSFPAEAVPEGPPIGPDPS